MKGSVIGSLLGAVLLSFTARAETLTGTLQVERALDPPQVYVLNGGGQIVSTTEAHHRQLAQFEGAPVVLQGTWDDNDDYAFRFDAKKPVVTLGKLKRSERGGPVDRLLTSEGNLVKIRFRKGAEPKAYKKAQWIVGRFWGNTNTFAVRSWSAARGTAVARLATTTATSASGLEPVASAAGLAR